MKFCFTAAFAVLLSLIVAGGPWSVAQGGPVPGAIFTTQGDGSAVNANHFDSKCAVYLDGGPGPHAPANAAGLPDGDYFFQVTDPSGKQLLSTDPVSNRRFKVMNGVIVAFTGIGGPVHPIGLDQDHPELGAITIRLANATCPDDFLDTANNGGTYKVWATPVSEYVGDPANVDNACGNGCFHGFVPAKSKTDNFKVKPIAATFCLTLKKQRAIDEGSPEPANYWQFDVTDPVGVTNSYFTDETGQLSVCGLAAGAYVIIEPEGMQEGWTVEKLTVNDKDAPPSPTYSFTWTAGQAPPVIEFINRFSTIGG